MSEMLVQALKDASGGNEMSIPDLNQGRAKAWANLNGSGTIALRDSFNVSAIQDNGVGDYSIAWSVPFLNANYASGISCDDGLAGASVVSATLYASGQQVSSGRYRVASSATGRTQYDAAEISVRTHGDQ